MKQRRSLKSIISLLLICFLVTSCGMSGAPDDETRGLETIANNQEGHYTFLPHVFGSRYLEQFGEETRDAFFAYCDALRKGEDTFACPDQDTFDWCTGRLAHFFFPVAEHNADEGYWEDGIAHIDYKIPKEEFLQKQKDFEEEITGILNDCLGDDYSDFEKILALYEYMTINYTYDYEMYDHSNEWMDRQGTCRALEEKQGICNEIASLYNYLLLQVGIDSEEMGGWSHHPDGIGDDAHSWVFVTLDGESYHIDPTYGLSYDRPPLCYFMMNDEIREERDYYPREQMTLAAGGDESRKLFEFEATSDAFSPLWGGDYVGMDRAAQEVVYMDIDGNLHRFSYAGK